MQLCETRSKTCRGNRKSSTQLTTSSRSLQPELRAERPSLQSGQQRSASLEYNQFLLTYKYHITSCASEKHCICIFNWEKNPSVGCARGTGFQAGYTVYIIVYIVCTEKEGRG